MDKERSVSVEIDTKWKSNRLFALSLDVFMKIFVLLPFSDKLSLAQTAFPAMIEWPDF